MQSSAIMLNGFHFRCRKTASLSVLSSAYAQSPSSTDTATEYIQIDKSAGGQIERLTSVTIQLA